ncbi:MAG: Sporulation and spore germination [uncultured Friedmanniella sp.]|uniref:Sporulation and spore germination n=1 Tax=uncultured Friedmanniella sp. TaxID=335381 RepID=A0A6J4K1S8_9ACTN|nr:GerMN domain-containing protein [uncultured Friedmanniella sp.]CAA9293655.1 MAG: Sporulation and spore germination [uncultured Friedmanniella sp.]
MRRRYRGLRLLAIVSFLFLLLGCGVSSQSQPVPLPTQPTPVVASAPVGRNGYTVTVYFVQFGRLAPVARSAPDTFPQTALRLLVDGPDTTEAAMGLETALVPQELGTVTGDRGPMTVEAGPEFTSIAGDNQLLAVAQLVWTATVSSPNSLVRIQVGGKPIEVPTDNGLSRLPVGRDDYMTVAPVEGPRAPATDSPAPTATPS